MPRWKYQWRCTWNTAVLQLSVKRFVATFTSWYQLSGRAVRWLKVVSQLSTWLNWWTESLDDSDSHAEAASSEHLSNKCSKSGSLYKVTVAQSVFIFVFLAGYDSNWGVFSKPGAHLTWKTQQAILNPSHATAKRVGFCWAPWQGLQHSGGPHSSELPSSHSGAWRLPAVSELQHIEAEWILCCLFFLGH